MAPRMGLGLRSPGYQSTSFIHKHEEAKEEVRKSGAIFLEFQEKLTPWGQPVSIFLTPQNSYSLLGSLLSPLSIEYADRHTMVTQFKTDPRSVSSAFCSCRPGGRTDGAIAGLVKRGLSNQAIWLEHEFQYFPIR